MDAAKVDAIGEEALATRKAPGFALAVAHKGKLVYSRGFGAADVEHEVAVEPQTRFAVGSLTKQFIAAGILCLAQRGVIDLNGPLSTYLTQLPNADAITLRMMLNHTSGLHNYPQLSEHAWPSVGAIPLSAIVEIVATDPPDFAPGTRWSYSNTNYTLLGAVIAEVSQSDEATFLRANIFEPLAMHATGYGFTAQRQPGLANAYRGVGTFTRQESVSLDLFAGAGGLVSTAVDLAAWDIALLNGTLLDSRWMAEFWNPGKLANGTPIPYAMGFVPTTLAGHRVVWHNGLTPGAGGYCYNAIFPDDELAVVVLSNGAEFQTVPERIVMHVLEALNTSYTVPPQAPLVPPPSEDPATTARAKDWLFRLQTGTVDLTQVDPRFAQLLTPDVLAHMQTALASSGTPTEWTYLGSESVPGAVITKYAVRLSDQPYTLSIGLTADGKIAGSLLQ
jgi:CubicO group peptidase (beta-lactamase class C family)